MATEHKITQNETPDISTTTFTYNTQSTHSLTLIYPIIKFLGVRGVACLCKKKKKKPQNPKNLKKKLNRIKLMNKIKLYSGSNKLYFVYQIGLELSLTIRKSVTALI